MFKLIKCRPDSDVPGLGVRKLAHEIQLDVQDPDHHNLVTARLTGDQAIILAVALLQAAGIKGTPAAQAYTTFCVKAP